MAKLQFVDLNDLSVFKDMMDEDHKKTLESAAKDSIKAASVSADGFTLFLYKTSSPASEDDAAFAIPLPNPTGKADKVKNATAGNFAGLDDKGNLTDSGKNADSFDVAGAAQIVDDKYKSAIGTIPSEYSNVVDMITKMVEAGTYDDTDVKLGIQANKDAIGVLNGTGAGSVKKQVADAVASIVAEAPEAYDTLKEISDWISTHGADAASMNSQINTNKEDIAKLVQLVGSLPEGTVATTIVDYISEYVTGVITDLDISKYATKETTNALSSRIDALETKDTELQAAIDANGAAVNTLSSKLTESVEGLQGSIDANAASIAAVQAKTELNATKITTLEGLVGDGFEAIPIENIKALFK